MSAFLMGIIVATVVKIHPKIMLTIYSSQKEKLKVKSPKIKDFRRLSIARIDQKFRKFARFLYIVQVGTQKIQKDVFKKKNHILLVAKSG